MGPCEHDMQPRAGAGRERRRSAEQRAHGPPRVPTPSLRIPAPQKGTAAGHCALALAGACATLELSPELKLHGSRHCRSLRSSFPSSGRKEGRPFGLAVAQAGAEGVGLQSRNGAHPQSGRRRLTQAAEKVAGCSKRGCRDTGISWLEAWLPCSKAAPFGTTDHTPSDRPNSHRHRPRDRKHPLLPQV